MTDYDRNHTPSTADFAITQKVRQQTNNNGFYKMVPPQYFGFYNNWVREWLYWYDGYVPHIHSSSGGILSTSIGTTIVNRCADLIYGANIMFANANEPVMKEVKNGKEISTALNFISDEWIDYCSGKEVIKNAIKNALAGGFSVIKLNKRNGELWIDQLRADRFLIDKNHSEVIKFIGILGYYDFIADENIKRTYAIVEERKYEYIGIFGEKIPTVEFKVYDTSNQVQILANVKDTASIPWEQLPKNVRRAIKADYGNIMLNKEMALNGFSNLGIYLLKASDGISNLPQLGLGESILANCMTYLYEYDFWNSAFNTDMYLARGHIMLPETMQSAENRAGANPSGFNSFIYTKYDTNVYGEYTKPESIQFALRSEEWKTARDIILQTIATTIGISISAIASYINDNSNRTAREVSAEETSTVLFIESMRRRFEVPINKMLKDVLRFYGIVDDVEIRWTKAGMTNNMLLVEILSKAKEAGLISGKKAHAMFNFDDDEEQNNEDYELVLRSENQFVNKNASEIEKTL